jgi:hypothetical protein
MMTTDQTVSQPSSPGVGPPPADSRASEIVLIEIARLRSEGEHTQRDLGELRNDMRDLRDRMARLESRVDHLPRKGFIVGSLVLSLIIVGGVVIIAPKLQSWVGITQAPQPRPAQFPISY